MAIRNMNCLWLEKIKMFPVSPFSFILSSLAYP